MGKTEEIDKGVKRLVGLINRCPRWKTISSCEGHPHDPKRGDHAFITLELMKKDMRDYGLFHGLLSKGIHVSFGHENRVILSHPWRQYGERPKRDKKHAYNRAFIRSAEKVLKDFIKKNG